MPAMVLPVCGWAVRVAVSDEITCSGLYKINDSFPSASERKC